MFLASGRKTPLLCVHGEMSEVSGRNEVHSGLSPRGPAIDMAGVLRQRQLSPIPLKSLETLKAFSGFGRVKIFPIEARMEEF